tara:strand:- start:486 stop:821 length:336 start_codon:yes stop_codon:yes gene_type:complete
MNNTVRGIMVIATIATGYGLGIEVCKKSHGDLAIQTRKEEIVENGEANPETRLIHEYIELNGDKRYDVHRVIFEKSGGRRTDSLDFHKGGITRELIESSPLVGDERRFLRY